MCFISLTSYPRFRTNREGTFYPAARLLRPLQERSDRGHDELSRRFTQIVPREPLPSSVLPGRRSRSHPGKERGAGTSLGGTVTKSVTRSVHGSLTVLSVDRRSERVAPLCAGCPRRCRPPSWRCRPAPCTRSTAARRRTRRFASGEDSAAAWKCHSLSFAG